MSLIECARLENDVESAKVMLSRDLDFNLPYLYNYFDEN